MPAQQVVGYVFPQNGPIQPGQVDAHAMTRINYAFAGLTGGRVTLASANAANDLAQLVSLRRENGELKILISVGGWLGSGGFSDAALTDATREAFAASAAELVEQDDLDGLDIDWEYPGMAGAGNPYRAEDKHNFTLLLGAVRHSFDALTRRTHRHYLLTLAAGASDEFLAHTEMAQVARWADSINLMTYDAYEAGSDEITGHHAPLYANPADPKRESADRYVRAFLAAGVPPGKLILGVPFYGRMWGQVPDVQHGLFQPGKAIPDSFAPFSRIQESFLAQGFVRYWDGAARVPYLYNAEKQIFISYEDQESLAGKCAYVKAKHLGGVMFWSYFNDDQGKLLDTIDRALLPHHK